MRLASSVPLRFPVPLLSLGVASGVRKGFISLKVIERLRLLCHILQQSQLVVGPPLPKLTTERLVHILDNEHLEHLFGIHRLAT